MSFALGVWVGASVVLGLWFARWMLFCHCEVCEKRRGR